MVAAGVGDDMIIGAAAGAALQPLVQPVVMMDEPQVLQLGAAAAVQVLHAGAGAEQPQAGAGAGAAQPQDGAGAEQQDFTR